MVQMLRDYLAWARTSRRIEATSPVCSGEAATQTNSSDQRPIPADARAVSRRRLAKIAVTALAVVGFGAAGLSGALARHSEGFDDDGVFGPSGGSGWDDVFGSGGSGGS